MMTDDELAGLITIIVFALIFCAIAVRLYRRRPWDTGSLLMLFTGNDVRFLHVTYDEGKSTILTKEKEPRLFFVPPDGKTQVNMRTGRRTKGVFVARSGEMHTRRFDLPRRRKSTTEDWPIFFLTKEEQRRAWRANAKDDIQDDARSIKNAENEKIKALLFDERGAQLVDVEYHRGRGLIIRRGRLGSIIESWIIQDAAKPAHTLIDEKNTRSPLIALVSGERYARIIPALTASARMQEIIQKTRDARIRATEEEIGKDLLEKGQRYGLHFDESVASRLVNHNNEIDNVEIAKLVNMQIADAYRIPESPLRKLALGGTFGFLMALVYRDFIPPEVTNSPLFGAIATTVIMLIFVWAGLKGGF